MYGKSIAFEVISKSNTTREMTEEEKALLKEQQQAFRQQLELDWED